MRTLIFFLIFGIGCLVGSDSDNELDPNNSKVQKQQEFPGQQKFDELSREIKADLDNKKQPTHAYQQIQHQDNQEEEINNQPNAQQFITKEDFQSYPSLRAINNAHNYCVNRLKKVDEFLKNTKPFLTIAINAMLTSCLLDCTDYDEAAQFVFKVLALPSIMINLFCNW